MRKNTSVPIDLFLITVLVFASILLFKNLGNIYFWEDEAETAFLGRSILQFGYPKSFDGVNQLKPILGADLEYWIYHPWFSFYVVALFFWLFGESTFSGRLPFVLFGLGSILLTYRLARYLYPQKGVARICILLLAFSVPFLIHMRQCRYYAPTLFFTLWAMLAFLKWIRKERFSTAQLLSALVLLYFTNNGMWIPLVVTQAIYLLLLERDRERIVKFGILLLLNLILAIPWVLISHTLSLAAVPTLEHTKKHLEFYIRVINKYVVPLLFWGIFLILMVVISRIRKKNQRIEDFLDRTKSHFKNRSSLLLLLWVGLTIGFLIFVEQRHFRYLISILPPLLLLEAVVLWQLFQSGYRKITVVLLLSLLFTNALNSPHRFFSPFYEYLYEITHDYDGPNEGIILYLKKHAKPTDTVKLKYEDNPVIFYTLLKVDNRWYTEEETYPEWIIPRRPWAEEGFWESAYHENIKKRYERIEIDYPDIQWENREEPGSHQFRTVREVPRVVIYRRKDRS